MCVCVRVHDILCAKKPIQLLTAPAALKLQPKTRHIYAQKYLPPISLVLRHSGQALLGLNPAEPCVKSITWYSCYIHHSVRGIENYRVISVIIDDWTAPTQVLQGPVSGTL